MHLGQTKPKSSYIWSKAERGRRTWKSGGYMKATGSAKTGAPTRLSLQRGGAPGTCHQLLATLPPPLWPGRQAPSERGRAVAGPSQACLALSARPLAWVLRPLMGSHSPGRGRPSSACPAGLSLLFPWVPFSLLFLFPSFSHCAPFFLTSFLPLPSLLFFRFLPTPTQHTHFKPYFKSSYLVFFLLGEKKAHHTHILKGGKPEKS